MNESDSTTELKMLRAGDTIQDGDELLCCNSWVKSCDIGRAITDAEEGWYRRRTPAPLATPEPSDKGMHPLIRETINELTGQAPPSPAQSNAGTPSVTLSADTAENAKASPEFADALGKMIECVTDAANNGLLNTPKTPEDFTAWVGSPTFEEAVAVTIRSSVQNGEQTEEMFNTIKRLSRELTSALAEVARLKALLSERTRQYGFVCGLRENANNERDDANSKAESYCSQLRERHAENETLRAEVARLKQELSDHAEDWAMCGIPHDSITAKALVLSDANRKLNEEVARLTGERDAWKLNEETARANGRELAEKLREANGELEHAQADHNGIHTQLCRSREVVEIRTKERDTALAELCALRRDVEARRRMVHRLTQILSNQALRDDEATRRAAYEECAALTPSTSTESQPNQGKD